MCRNYVKYILSPFLAVELVGGHVGLVAGGVRLVAGVVVDVLELLHLGFHAQLLVDLVEPSLLGLLQTINLQ